MVAEMEQVKYSRTDRAILESCKTVLEGLALYLGSSYELVLHSLEDFNRSVIAIYNGEHTGRSVGAPITDLAVSMLETLNHGQPAIVYFSENKNGEPLKSTTIPIKNEQGRIIGLLCINLYLNSSLCDVLRDLTPLPGQGYGAVRSEYFAADPNELLLSALERVRGQVMADESILPSMKNKIIVERLYQSGMFRFKDAVVIIAEHMGISRNTIYMHIRNCRRSLGEGE